MSTPKQIPEDPGDGNTITPAAVMSLSDKVHEYFHHSAVVREAAKKAAKRGEKPALVKLYQEACLWNEAFEDACRAQPEMAKEVAATRAHWPGNYAGHPTAIDSLKTCLRDLGLGSALRHRGASSVPWKGRKRLDSPAQEIAIDLNDWIIRTRKAGLSSATTAFEREACELPPITDKKSGEQLFACTWRQYEAYHSGDVLRDPTAAKIAGTRPRGRNKPAGYVKQKVRAACGWIPK
jgi:hypothetical protein